MLDNDFLEAQAAPSPEFPTIIAMLPGQQAAYIRDKLVIRPGVKSPVPETIRGSTIK
jgi:hypothetical protein